MSPMSVVRPRVYFASKLRHASMWREWKAAAVPLNVISTWHDHEKLDEHDRDACYVNWQHNRIQLIHSADLIIAYAERDDPLNGTLVEIGIAVARELPIHLAGGFNWGTWRHFPFVKVYPTLHDILFAITKGTSP